MQQSDATGNGNPATGNKLMTKAEYARHAGLNRSTVTRQVASGAIPSHGGLIDAAEADKARLANIDETKRRKVISSVAPAQPIRPVQTFVQPTLDLPEDHPVTLADEQRKLVGAKAAMADIELARRRGEVVPVAEVNESLGGLIVSVRGRLLSVSDKLCDQLAAVKDPREVRDILDHEIRIALQELSEYRVQAAA